MYALTHTVTAVCRCFNRLCLHSGNSNCNQLIINDILLLFLFFFHVLELSQITTNPKG